jgi:hypothetical protein
LATNNNNIPPESSGEPRVRGEPREESPFCWQSKAALTRINELGLTRAALAKAVYLSLTWLASDTESPTFEAYVAVVADRAKLGMTTTRTYLRELERIGVLRTHHRQIPGRKAHAASVFALLTCNTGRRTSTVLRRTSTAGADAPGGGLERIRKEQPSLDEVLLECTNARMTEAEGARFFNYYESNGWRVGRNPMKSWRHALANWQTRNNHSQANKKRPNHKEGF